MIRSNTTRIITHLFVFVVSIALVGADLFVSAQNTNSSTTSDNTSMQDNTMSGTNTSRRSTGRRRRRGRRRSSNNAGMANANAASDAMQDNTSTEGSMQANDNAAGAASNTSMTGGGRRRRRGRRRGGNMSAGAAATTDMGSTSMTPVRTGRCDPMAQEQTDLSGTYTGTANYTEGGLSGDTTLTITGNDFTMTSGSTTLEGRVVAVTTCNYTAVTMRLGKDTTVAPGATPPPPLPTVSLRAKRMGSGLSLTSVSGESKQFSFSSAGTSGGRRRGRRRGSKPSTVSACGPMAHSISAQ